MQTSSLFIVAVLVAAGLLYWWYNSRQNENGGAANGKAVLSTYTRDLTKEAAAEKLDPVIGRAEEIERVVHILSRRSKNNPLLIGEPGVGKTAIVEGIARRIAAGDVPENLKGKRVLSLDLGGLISGTKYRGEFEERMKKLTNEIQVLARQIILFIDEIHMIEQAKGAEGAMNASDILKPALSRGELQAIGATTWKEYEKFIRPDDALNRRFQPVIVGEPTPEAALEIVRGVKGNYESYHRVRFDDAALVAAVELSKKSILDRYLPDKAIDLIDEAGAKVSIEASHGTRHALALLNAAGQNVGVKKLETEEKAIATELEHLNKLQTEMAGETEIAEIKNRIEHLLSARKKSRTDGDPEKIPTVTEADIREIVAEWSGRSEIKNHR